MPDQTQPTPAAETLRRLTGEQARALLARMLAAGQLPPPASLPVRPAPQLAESSVLLAEVLGSQAAAWGQRAALGSAAAHFSNALLYAAVMLGSVRELGRPPLDVLALFSSWASSFMCEALEAGGLDPLPVLDATEGGTFGPVLRLGVLERLDPQPRGAFMAALAVFYAVSHVLTVPTSADDLHRLMARAGGILGGGPQPEALKA